MQAKLQTADMTGPRGFLDTMVRRWRDACLSSKIYTLGALPRVKFVPRSSGFDWAKEAFVSSAAPNDSHLCCGVLRVWECDPYVGVKKEGR